MKQRSLHFLVIIAVMGGLLFPVLISAQITDTTDIELARIMEVITEQSDKNLNYNTVRENLYYYLQHPINLNQADAEQLEELYFLNELQIKSFLQHRQKVGELVSIYELQSIEHFDPSLIRLLLPFVTIDQEATDYHSSFRQRIVSGKHQLFLRSDRILETQEGYVIPDTNHSHSRYLGNPYSFYARYTYRNKRVLRWGITAEKDEGEEFFQGTQQQGFDFYSGHLYFQTNSVLKEVALGDYELNFGQGLTMWTGFGFAKTPAVLNINRQGKLLNAYTSVNENNFLRGIATKWQYHNFKAATFVSYKKRDGNILSFDTARSSIKSISSLPKSGYHRTPNDINDRKVVDETVYGGHVSYSNSYLNIGGTFITHHLNVPLKSTHQYWHDLYQISGNHLSNYSLDYSVVYKNINIFGEAAISSNGGKAFVNGGLISLTPHIDLGILHRYLTPQYHAFYNNIFAENGAGNNEKGLFLSLQWQLMKHLQFSTYFDVYQHPWLSYQTDAPSHGYDYITELQWKPSLPINISLRWSSAKEQENTPSPSPPLPSIAVTQKSRLRYHMEYQLFDQLLTFRNRISFSFYQQKQHAEEGYMIYQDIIIKKPSSLPLSLAGRLAYFNTASYKTAIWAYENDVLYTFSIPPYFNEGSRAYLLLQYKISSQIDVWMRWSQTYYPHKSSIGSGLNQINNNTKTGVKAQLRFQF